MNQYPSVHDICQVEILFIPSHDLNGFVFVQGISNVYGSPIMTLAGAPLTTLSTMNNGAIHFPSK